MPHNPNKPSGDVDDGGLAENDATSAAGDTGADLPKAPDTRMDLAPAELSLAEPPPDGSVPPDTLPADVAPDQGACQPACTEGAKRCGPGGGLQTCVALAGCPDWGPETTCGDNATCAGAAPAAACACKAAPSCNGVGTFCKNASTVGTCAKDSFGCVYVAPTT